MNQLAKVILKSGKERSLDRFHPWLFSGAIKNIEGEVQEGDVVEICNNKGEYIATGHYQIGSITVRIFSFRKGLPDKEFWKSKFMNAYNVRKRLNFTDNPNTNVYRLINGEGDGFPGMIIDYYNGTIVFQAHSIGMYLLREMFAEILKDIYKEKLISVFDKSEETLPRKADIKPVNGYLFGKQSENMIKENGLNYYIDIAAGQKTGFYIDQRDNRQLLGTYSKDRFVLNAFSYTGGFSLAALKGGAKLVHSVDSSQKAIDILNRNIELNFRDVFPHQSFVSEVFSFLQDIEDKYDLIILDPPAFGKHVNVLDNALKGYRNLNKQAIEKIKPGGILFTFSCSQIVSRDDFRKTIFSAAAIARRPVRILHQLSQPADHPIDIYHPEGEYLKGLVLEVGR